MEQTFFPSSTTVPSFPTIDQTLLSFNNDYRSPDSNSSYLETVGQAATYEDSAYTHLGSRRDTLYVVVPITIIYLSIFITGTIGNVSTCIVIARNKSMHTATNYYLFSLAVSDLLLLVSGLPIEVYLVWSKYPYVFGEHFCRLRGLAAECSTNASVLTITAFTVERYVAICHPFLSHTMSKLSRAIKLILVIWLVALSFATPLAMQFGIVDRRDLNPDYVMCALKITLVKHSFEISTFLFFVVPMILITVLYVMIALKLRQSNMMKRDNGHDRAAARTSSSSFYTNSARKDERNCRHHTGKSSRRVLKMLVAVVVAFFLCWAPFHVQRLIAIYGTDEDLVTSKSKWIEFLYLSFTYVSGVLYYVSATINPILYNIMSNKFREAFMETLARSCGKRNIPQEQRSYSSFSRSQQQRGTAATFGSRNITGGSGMAQESSDYSANSAREDNNCARLNSSINGQTKVAENSDVNKDSMRRIDETPFARSTSRKLNERGEFGSDEEARLRRSSETTNAEVEDKRRPNSTDENCDRSERWGKNSKRSKNHLFIPMGKNNRIDKTRTKKRSVEPRGNYEPIAIRSNRTARKKWWRFFKWLPNAKDFGFSNDRAQYASPAHSIINDVVENNRETYSMTVLYTGNANQRLV